MVNTAVTTTFHLKHLLLNSFTFRTGNDNNVPAINDDCSDQSKPQQKKSSIGDIGQAYFACRGMLKFFMVLLVLLIPRWKFSLKYSISLENFQEKSRRVCLVCMYVCLYVCLSVHCHSLLRFSGEQLKA